jgi:hypothetical protein
MRPHLVWRMIQRRAAELGMRIRIGWHTFRATGITAYLEITSITGASPAATGRYLTQD